MQIFGHATKGELKKHLFDFHGIDDTNDTLEIFHTSKAEHSNPSKRPGEFTCSFCGSKYTRNHNLIKHMRTKHESSATESFKCDTCGKTFKAKYERDRHHKSAHGGESYKCSGVLANGNTWGCKKSFTRSDKLAAHLKSKKGQTCIRPLLLEYDQRENLDTAASASHHEDALLPGILPSFEEFLRICGLDRDLLRRDNDKSGDSPSKRGTVTDPLGTKETYNEAFDETLHGTDVCSEEERWDF
jgi:hypothetical protein